MVIRNGDGRSVTDDIAKLQAKLDPARGVLRVTVRLVAGKEQQIWILSFQVVDNLRSQPRRATGITRHIGDDDDILCDGILANQTFESRPFAVSHTIRHVLAVVPVVDPKVRTPTRIENGLFRDLFPLAVLLELKPCFARFTGFQRVKLGGQLEDAMIVRVQSKRDDFVTRHIHRRWRVPSLGRFRAPPLSDRE